MNKYTLIYQTFINCVDSKNYRKYFLALIKILALRREHFLVSVKHDITYSAYSGQFILINPKICQGSTDKILVVGNWFTYLSTGWNRLARDLKLMCGRSPNIVWRICLQYLTPLVTLVCTCIFVCANIYFIIIIHQ